MFEDEALEDREAEKHHAKRMKMLKDEMLKEKSDRRKLSMVSQECRSVQIATGSQPGLYQPPPDSGAAAGSVEAPAGRSGGGQDAVRAFDDSGAPSLMHATAKRPNVAPKPAVAKAKADGGMADG